MKNYLTRLLPSVWRETDRLDEDAGYLDQGDSDVLCGVKEPGDTRKLLFSSLCVAKTVTETSNCECTHGLAGKRLVKNDG